MYELKQERNVFERMSADAYDENEDYDFDVYLWYPYSHPEVVMSASGVDSGAELPFIFERQVDDELDDTSSYWLPLSPTYSVVSDFVFPGKREMDKAGYSNLFCSGLVSTSKRVTHRLERLLRSIRRHLQILIGRLKG